MDWQQLLHNRWVWAGGAVAAGAGALVLIRRKQTTGSTSTSTGAQASPAYASGSVGGFDSTGTDVASWLGSYSANLQNQLDAYQQQLSDSLAGIPTGATGTGTPGAGGIPAPKYVQGDAGTQLYDFSSQNQLADGLNTLRLLNPGLDANIAWSGANGTTKTPRLKTTQKLRVA